MHFLSMNPNPLWNANWTFSSINKPSYFEITDSSFASGMINRSGSAQSMLAVDLIFSHLQQSLYPCNFEVKPEKGLKRNGRNSPP